MSVKVFKSFTKSGMLAVAVDDFSVVVIDCDVKKVVRKFSGHSNKISDMVSLKNNNNLNYKKNLEFLFQRHLALTHDG